MAENGFNEQGMQVIEGSFEVTDQIFGAASVDMVYAEPVEAGQYTIITASEVFAAGGIGSGYGSGIDDETLEEGEGVGMGGGGTSSARPVAAIVIGPGGVRVEPIVDVSKLGIAFISAMAGIFIAVGRMNCAAKQ